MRGWIWSTVGVVACVAAASCGSNSAGGPGDHTVTLSGTGFSADAGDLAFFRIITGGTVAFCTSGSVGGGNPSFSFTSPAVLGTTQSYTGELFIDINTDGLYEKTADDEWKIAIGKITSGTAALLTVSATDPQSGISWKGNKGCPGK